MRIGQTLIRVGEVGDKVVGVGTVFPPHTTLHERSNDVVVLRKPGHKRFGGQGAPRIYSPLAFAVYRVIEESEEWGELLVENLITFEVRR